MFELKLERATEILRNKSDYYSQFLNLKILFVKNILVGGDESLNKFELFFDKAYKNIKQAAPDSLCDVFISEILLEKSIVELLNRNFITGAYTFIKSYSYFEDSQNKFPGLEYAKKLKSLFKIIAGITPDKGQSFLKLIGLKGDVNIGVGLMNNYLKYAKNKEILKDEAKLIMFLTQQYLKDDTGKEDSKTIFVAGNKNLLKFANALILFKQNKYKNTVLLLNELLAADIDTVPFLYYLSGITQSVLNSRQAKFMLVKYTKESRSNHFIKASYWQLARLSVLQDDIDGFKKYRILTLERGSGFTEADKSAMYEASKKTIPNKVLLESRLYFDAGEFDYAMKVLLSPDAKRYIKTRSEQAEFFYRLGRVFHNKNNLQKALKYYLKVCEKYPDIKEYFVPYSAFLVGEIYEINSKYELAKQFYLLAGKLNNNNYRNSLKHKIQNRLNKYQ